MNVRNARLDRHSCCDRMLPTISALQVADLIRRRKCACPAEMVTTLLVLKLKDAEHQSASKGRHPLLCIQYA